jgi:hypothetical protein
MKVEIMEKTYLQTVVTGCAWCKSVIDFSTHEVRERGEQNFMLLSHGICLDCKGNFDLEEESEEDEDLVYA